MLLDDFAVCNVLQSLQLIFNVGIIILGNGQGLSQVVMFKVCFCKVTVVYMFLREQLCFSVCNIVWMIAGRSRPYILGKNKHTILRRNVLGSGQNIAKVRLGRKRFHLAEHHRVDHHHGCCCTLTPQFCGSEV